jgi:uncharacterized protein (DUF1015 family)
MAKITPFRAVRAKRDKVHMVATRPVYNYPRRILNAKLDTNPYTFLHVVYPEYKELKADRTAPNTKARFEKIRQRYRKFHQDGIFFKDDRPNLYIYRQVNGENVYHGIVAGISIDDYFSGVIKVHEQTLTKREQIFKEYLDTTKFNAEPVLLTYPDNPTIDNILNMYMAERPEYDFTNTDQVRHTMWRIDEPSDISRIEQVFSRFKSIYIADGHHRSASSALYGKDRREQSEKFTGEEPFNYFMGCFIPESQLDIYDFNRVVRDLNGHSPETFLELLNSQFDVECKGSGVYRTEKQHSFSMYLDGKWYALTCKPGSFDDDDPVGGLDSHILTKNILTPLLGIKDLKTNQRISFVGGLKGMEALQAKVHSGKYKVAFGLFPVSVKQLKHVADTGNSMPPKTTWIEPKMRSGLTIFEI